MASMSYIRYIYNRRKRKEEELVPVIDELLIQYIFDDSDAYTEQDIYEDFTKRVGKLSKTNLDLITKRLILAKINFNFKVNEPFNRLIRALGIEAFIEKKLDFSNAYDKMKGIQELSALSITTSESKIFPFTYSVNKNVRKEARSSYLRLSKNDPFKFFDEATETLNEWDQINLLKQLLSIENTIIPNFSKWVAYSKNESIVSFSIKMCAYFKQKESIPTLIETLKHDNHILRAEAIKALGELQATDYEDLLRDMYANQPDNCQVEIIRAIGKFHTGKSLGFLKQTFDESIQTDTKKVIAEAINNYGPDGKALFEEMLKTETGFPHLILQHIANPLIKFK